MTLTKGRKINAKDLVNSFFGKWKVLEKSSKKDKNTWWFCVCECGTEKEVVQYSLLNGRSKSCGCDFEGKGLRKNIKERRKLIRDLLLKGYSQLDILSKVYTSTITIQQERIPLKNDKEYARTQGKRN